MFYTQLTANAETSFVQTPAQKYCFIIAFVFVARKAAHISAFAINPAITLATAAMGVLMCQFEYLGISWVYLLGDFLGALLGTLAYNNLYVPALLQARRHSLRAKQRDQEMQALVHSRMDSNFEQQSVSLSGNLT